MPRESSAKISLAVPAIEALFSGTASLWPAGIVNDPGLIRQVELRRKLLAALAVIFKNIPDPAMEISQAIETGAVKSEAAREFYELLAEFLDADSIHRRLVLYFPFELIPPSTQPLNSFIASYLRCWYKLLEESDVRANFIDGNILEPELCPYGQPLVQKAAHLIPQLVKRKLITLSDVATIMAKTTDETLRNSITEATNALAEQVNPKNTASLKVSITSLEKFSEEIEFEVKKIAMRCALDQSHGVPIARVAWERLDKRESLISSYAEIIAEMVVAGTITKSEFLRTLTTETLEARLAIMRGIGMAVERYEKIDHAKAEELSRIFIKSIETAPMISDPAVHDLLESVLVRWVNGGIISGSCLQQFGFELPQFNSPFTEANILATEIKEFSTAIKLIVKNSAFSRFLYPAAIFFGSRLKGYAKKDADLDVAIFVKPGIKKKEREQIHRLLNRVFKSKKIDGKIVEFWLKVRGNELRIRDFKNPDVLLADSTWAHVLFAGVWLGEEKALRDLYQKLLPGFLYSRRRTYEGHDARALWLSNIEREVLQYRLMHKGYQRFFPPAGGIDITGAVQLDPQSTFWDSGYRRLATELFVSRVFLPQLATYEKK
jgi:predicted nucleotidyltransferase